jgi:peptide deformylase
MINPELVRAEGDTETAEEGCLSIPEVLGDVTRPSRVVMRGTNLDCESVTVEATGLLGRCLLHELDHLNGRLFIDYLSFLKKRRALAEWAKYEPDFPGHVRILSPDDADDADGPASGDDL